VEIKCTDNIKTRTNFKELKTNKKLKNQSQNALNQPQSDHNVTHRHPRDFLRESRLSTWPFAFPETGFTASYQRKQQSQFTDILICHNSVDTYKQNEIKTNKIIHHLNWLSQCQTHQCTNSRICTLPWSHHFRL